MQRFVPAAPGIRFSNCSFSEPVPLARWWQPRGLGLYAILIPDSTWGPRAFQPIYFGEYGTQAHVSQEEYVGWFRVAAGRDLHVAAHELHLCPPGDVASVRAELVAAYGPICNRLGRVEQPPNAFSLRIDAIERRDQDHDALLRVLLAAMGKLLEPQPEPRKRAFGFHSTRHKSADRA